VHDKFQTLKRASYVAFAAMAVLLLLAVVYYKERALFIDSSYVLFNIVNKGELMIQENRFGSFITQIIPFMCAKLHLPMSVILISYTISFNVFYLLVISILVFRFRQYGLAILMCLYYLLFVTDTFYWTNNEVHQGIAWMFLMLGFTLRGGEKEWNTVLLVTCFVVFGILAASSHMLVIMPLTFLWFYIIFDCDICPFNLTKTILLSALLLLIVWIKYHYSVSQPYDGQKLKATTDFTFKYLYEVAVGTFGKDFLKQCIKVYWLVPVTFLLGMYSLLRDKKYRQSIMVIGAAVLYYLFMCLTFSNTYYMHRFHIESEWMGLAIITSAPFVFSYLPKLKPNVAMMVLIGIVAIKLVYITRSSSWFVERQQFMAQILGEMKEKGIYKLALQPDKRIEKKLILDWATPEESILLSAINNDEPRRTFVVLPGMGVTEAALKSNRNLIISYTNIEPQDVNNAYFNINRDTCYTVMTYDELMK
jgi:hypothetical protein